MDSSSNIFSNELASLALLNKIQNLRQKKPILVIGDCLLDCYIKGDTNRISREAPIPILDHCSESYLPGGAANTACNIAGMGCPVILLGVIGNDKHGEILLKSLKKHKILIQNLLINSNFKTIVKTRFISQSQQMFRFDIKNTIDSLVISENNLLSSIENLIPDVGAILFSDYGNGVLTENVLQFAIKSARKMGILTVVDPRSTDMKRYSGADFITPNLEELQKSFNIPVTSDKEIISASNELIKKYSFKGVLATNGAKGLTLIYNNEVEHFPAKKRKVFDVTGAGDCVISWFTMAIYAGISYQNSAMLANLAGGLAVEVVGVAVLTLSDLRKAIQYPVSGYDGKIFNISDLETLVEIWKHKNYLIGLTNGCFDIFHAGHVAQIHYAKSNCDKLILALNSDQSVSKLKGPNRPLQNQYHRSQMIAALMDVDAVIIFNEVNVCKLISKIKPNLYIKGADYNLDTLEEAILVRSYGGKCMSAPLLDDLSSTKIINKIIENHH